ncbi:hypothetical protein MFIFM68171_07652 [Madurella fahalii]|uniref:Uncharacterized protein n=1 Tax=Madurella fahalii TaxID=1157608 RepID=A0ABQ0GI83_9PEZI
MFGAISILLVPPEFGDTINPKSKGPSFFNLEDSKTVRHICIIYNHLLANGATSHIPTFYDYLGLSYAELEGQRDENVRREVWKAIEREIGPIVVSWQRQTDAAEGGDEALMAEGSDTSYEHLHEDLPPPRVGMLSDDDIKRAVAEVLLRDNMRGVYNKFMMAQNVAIDDRKRFLETWCYEGWGDQPVVEGE